MNKILEALADSPTLTCSLRGTTKALIILRQQYKHEYHKVTKAFLVLLLEMLVMTADEDKSLEDNYITNEHDLAHSRGRS